MEQADYTSRQSVAMYLARLGMYQQLLEGGDLRKRQGARGG